MTVKKVLRCTLLAAWIGSLTTAACASETRDARAVRVVSVAGLDLTREAGAAALYARIKSAARTVCRPRFVDFAVDDVVSTRLCVADAIARAVADVNSPALTSYHLMKTGRAITLSQQ